MSKYESSLGGPKPAQVHTTQYKAKDFKDASGGRVMKEGKKTIAEMSRPAGRTGYIAGSKTASTNAKD